MLNWADQNSSRMQGLREEGFVSDGAREQPRSTAAPAAYDPAVVDRVIAQAAFAPMDTMQIVASETSLAPALVDGAMEAMTLLSDDGVPPEMKQEARARVEVFLAKARENADAASPQVQATIERAEEWLRL